MWFILFLFPSYPNLNYKIEPSPTLTYTLSICDFVLAWRLLEGAASVFVCLKCKVQSCCVKDLLSYLLLCITLEGCAPFLLFAVDCAKDAATCCLRVPISVLRVPWPVKRVPLPVRKVPLPVGEYRWLFKGAAVYEKVPLLSWRVPLPVERYRWLPGVISECDLYCLLQLHLDCTLVCCGYHNVRVLLLGFCFTFVLTMVAWKVPSNGGL